MTNAGYSPEISKISVLYVDDEENVLEITKLYLEETGEFIVDTIISAQSALETLDIPSYDAIVSDHVMPGIDGITFLKIVRERYGDIPFILFKAESRVEVLIEATNNGADYFLQKGADPETMYAELAHRIRQEVRKRREERAARENDEKNRTFLENTSAIFYSLTPDGNFPMSLPMLLIFLDIKFRTSSADQQISSFMLMNLS
ncbi:MAG: response regulator [Methanomicrobiales archaeon]|nr:response regulator [Methanomicrobiales archaeon]